MSRDLQLLTSSRLKAYRRCSRFHHLRYELGLHPVAERIEALFFGTLIHLGLEAWWRALGERYACVACSGAGEVEVDGGMVLCGTCPDPLERAIAALQEQGAEAFALVRAEVLLEGYHHRWIDAGLRPIAVEVEFRAPLRNPETGAASKTWQLAGKLDVIAEDAGGRVVIIEHKSSSEDVGIGSTYWIRLRMDGQVSQYFDGASSLGYDAAACVYDVIAKPTIRPYRATPVDERKYTKEKRDKEGNVVEPSRLYANQREADETPEEYRARLREAIAADPDRYYQRGEVVRLEEELRDHAFDAWQLGRQIREAELAGRAPRNPDACAMFGRTCEYFSICAGEASLDDTTRFVRVDNVHPELADASQPAPELGA